jgi:hypothetical protein
MRSCCLIRIEFQFHKMEKVLETNGDGCITMWMFQCHWITHLKKITCLSAIPALKSRRIMNSRPACATQWDPASKNQNK